MKRGPAMAIAAASLLGVGFWGGRASRPSAPAMAAPNGAAAREPERSSPTTAGSPAEQPPRWREAIPLGAIRAIVREEVQAACAAGAPTSTASTGPETASPAEVERAVRAGKDLVEQAKRTRVWTEAQSDELRDLAATLPAPQYDALLRLLIPAINAGEISVDPALRALSF